MHSGLFQYILLDYISKN